MKILFLALIAPSLLADTQNDLAARGFSILDRICVEVEGETPILKSEIDRRASQKSVSFFEAQNEFINERLLWVYAKKQMKYSITDVFNAAKSHAEKVQKDNKLTKEQFKQVLARKPYEISYDQYLRDTSYAMLENLVKSTMASQVTVSDAELEQQDGIVFISLVPKKTAKAKPNDELLKIKKIGLEITQKTSLDDLKEKQKKHNDFLILGPFQKDELDKSYNERLAKTALISEPFWDNGAATVIWKVKKTNKKLDAYALEKVRKELYEGKVIKNFTAALEAVKGNSTLTIKGCGK